LNSAPTRSGGGILRSAQEDMGFTQEVMGEFRWNPFFYFGGGCPTLVELPLLVQQGFPVMWRIADLDPWLIL